MFKEWISKFHSLAAARGFITALEDITESIEKDESFDEGLIDGLIEYLQSLKGKKNASS